MIRVRRHHVFAARRMAGLSLIELMIALVMALIVAAGIITVFQSTSSSNKVQAQLAVLQEEGRFAIHSLRTDISNANGGYCSNTGGNTGVTSSGLYIDGLRSPVVYAPAPISFPDNTFSLPAPTQAYSLPSPIFMRGYDCGAASCIPAGLAALAPAQIPAMSTSIGYRVPGADVLTIRYLKPGSGWTIVPSGGTGSTITATSGKVTAINLSPISHEDPVSAFSAGDLAMLANCSGAQVFAVHKSSGTLTPVSATTTTTANYAQPADITHSAAPRVFDFTKDFQTVTYYLRVVDAGNGHTTGELVRQINGNPQSLVRGVERLDFRYGIINADGTTRFLTADQVDSGDGNTIPCPPGIIDNVGSMPGNTPGTGCLWRAVQTIEVNILMDGQTPLYTLTPAEMNYIYSPDGDTVPTPPSARSITPALQGFPKQLLRREFTTLVSLRNYNP